ncbi:class I SAM-dependent DNA methyltransferase [Patescibacteria group bacterium]
MRTEKMWKELAKYYDLIYEEKPYKKEAEKIHKLIQRYKKSSGRELLDVACGTGSHIAYFKKHYKIIGSDLNKEMLKIARKKFPKIRFQQANMTSLNLKKKFDVITCLFSSIGYVKTYNNLNKTITAFARHLKPGGVLIIELFISKRIYRTGGLHTSFVDKPDVKITRMNVSKRRGNIAILDFSFLVGTKKGIKFFRDKHELGLFDTTKILKALKENGFQAKFLKDGLMKGRGLYVAVKK